LFFLLADLINDSHGSIALWAPGFPEGKRRNSGLFVDQGKTATLY